MTSIGYAIPGNPEEIEYAAKYFKLKILRKIKEFQNKGYSVLIRDKKTVWGDEIYCVGQVINRFFDTSSFNQTASTTLRGVYLGKKRVLTAPYFILGKGKAKFLDGVNFE